MALTVDSALDEVVKEQSVKQQAVDDPNDITKASEIEIPPPTETKRSKRKETLECPRCEQNLSSRQILVRHCRDNHGINLNQEPIDVKKFPCPISGCKSGPFKRKHQLYTHKRAKHKNYLSIDNASVVESLSHDPPTLSSTYTWTNKRIRDLISTRNLSSPESSDLTADEKAVQDPSSMATGTEFLDQGIEIPIEGQRLPDIHRPDLTNDLGTLSGNSKSNSSNSPTEQSKVLISSNAHF